MSIRFDRFTIKAQEAFQEAQTIALDRGQQAAEVEHLLLALINQERRLDVQLLQKLGRKYGGIISQLEEEIDKLPRVEGAGAGQIYMSTRLNNAAEAAFNEMRTFAMNISALNMFLAIADEKHGISARILKENGVSKDAIMKSSRKCGAHPASLTRILRINTKPLRNTAAPH